MNIDGSFLLGIAGLVTALTGAGLLGRRGLSRQRRGVPASEDQIDRDLLQDRANLLAELEAARRDVDRIEDLRIAQTRALNDKIDAVVRERNAVVDVSTRNRRRFIERYGMDSLGVFEEMPSLQQTWTPEELRRYRDLG